MTDNDDDHNDTDDTDDTDHGGIRAPVRLVGLPLDLADRCILLADDLMRAEAVAHQFPRLAMTLLAGLVRLHGGPVEELSRRIQWAQQGRSHVDFELETGAEEEEEEEER